MRLRGHSFGTFGVLLRGCSFRTLFGLFRGSGPEDPGVGRGQSQLSREGVCRNPKGIFLSPGRILRGFFGGFFRAFFLGKNRRKTSTQKSTVIFKSEFGSFAAKIHTARTLEQLLSLSFIGQFLLRCEDAHWIASGATLSEEFL